MSFASFRISENLYCTCFGRANGRNLRMMSTCGLRCVFRLIEMDMHVIHWNESVQSAWLQAMLTGYRGTFPYMAPELMSNQSPPVVGPHADVYSFGLLLMEIIRGIRNQSQGQPNFRDIAHHCTDAGDVRRLYKCAFPAGYIRGGGASRMLAISIMCTKVQHLLQLFTHLQKPLSGLYKLKY